MKTYTPLQYLQIDIANHYGLDKLQFEERIQWVLDNEEHLESKTEMADDKYRYIAAILAYRQAQNNEPVHHLVGLDANASGIAILGAISGCKTTARNTGIIGKQQKDVYGICTDIMSALLDSDVEVPRKEVKSALMPCYYGSKVAPKEVFGKDTDELEAFEEASQAVAPGAHVLKDTLLMAWQPNVLKHSWVMPDGFKVEIPVLQTMETTLRIKELDDTRIKMLYEDNVGSEEGLSLVANVTHSIDGMLVREVARRCNYNDTQLERVRDILYQRIHTGKTGKDCPHIEGLWNETGFLSLTGVECINEESVYDFGLNYCSELLELIECTLQKPTFEVLFIHKSLWM